MKVGEDMASMIHILSSTQIKDNYPLEVRDWNRNTSLMGLGQYYRKTYLTGILLTLGTFPMEQ